MDPITIGSLIAGGLVSAGSALAGARQNRLAQEEENKAYNQLRLGKIADLYRSPEDSISGRALLKSTDEKAEDMNDAIDNKMAAGGATVENTLAAKQNVNKMMSDVRTSLLLHEDERQQRARNAIDALDMQHSQNLQNNYRANAQNWAQWGAATSNALTQFGLANYLNGTETPSLLHRQADTAAFRKKTFPELAG